MSGCPQPNNRLALLAWCRSRRSANSLIALCCVCRRIFASAPLLLCLLYAAPSFIAKLMMLPETLPVLLAALPTVSLPF